MLDQEKVGRYIAEKRRQLGMTQKQVAEQLGITDKAVSKWETGKSMPDHAIIDDVCKVLQIGGINALLAGEDIPEDTYFDKAEENMKVLMKEQNFQRKNKKYVFASLILGVVMLLLGSWAVYLEAKGLAWLTGFIDIPSFLLIIGSVLVILVVSGAIMDFFQAFVICFGKSETTEAQVTKSERAVRLVLIFNILVGAFLFVGRLVMIRFLTLETEQLFATISLILLTPWYSLLLDILLIPFYYRLRQRKE